MVGESWSDWRNVGNVGDMEEGRVGSGGRFGE